MQNSGSIGLAINAVLSEAFLQRFWENCPRGKLPHSPNSNANSKPNSDPYRGAIFRKPLQQMESKAIYEGHIKEVRY